MRWSDPVRTVLALLLLARNLAGETGGIFHGGFDARRRLLGARAKLPRPESQGGEVPQDQGEKCPGVRLHHRDAYIR